MIPNGYNNRNNRRSLGRTTMTSFPSTFDLIKLFLLSAIWIFGIYNFSVNSFSFLSSFNLKNSFTNIFYAPEHQHDLVVDYSACKHLTVGSESHTKCMIDLKAAYQDAQEKCMGYITTLSACKSSAQQGGKCRVEEANVANCVNAITLETKAKWKDESR